jgi:DNA-directed RNA polymerase subunit N (RpoN/RPB10)
MLGQKHDIRCMRCGQVVGKYYKVSVSDEWFKSETIEVCGACRDALLLWLKTVPKK